MPNRNRLFGILGNVVEWFEFGVYGYFAPVIGHVFFPERSEYTAALSGFAVFAVGFVARPVGAVVFGALGDTTGRVPALTSSILAMAVVTCAIGLLPGYASIGLLATVLICLLRIGQGLALGGEYGGSITFLYEHSPPGRHGLYTSYAVASTIAGILLGSLCGGVLYNMLSEAQLYGWGWRIPFFTAGALGFVVYLARSAARESYAAGGAARTRPGAVPLLRLWRLHRRETGLMVVSLAQQAAGFYLIFVFLPLQLARQRGAGAPVYYVNTLAMLALCSILPAAGALSDHFNRTRFLSWASLAYSVAVLVVLSDPEPSITGYAAALAVLVVAHALVAGPTPALLAEQFPDPVRYTAVAVSYNIGISLFGGLAPLTAIWLTQVMPGVSWPAVLVAAAGAASAISLRLASRRAESDLT